MSILLTSTLPQNLAQTTWHLAKNMLPKLKRNVEVLACMTISTRACIYVYKSFKHANVLINHSKAQTTAALPPQCQPTQSNHCGVGWLKYSTRTAYWSDHTMFHVAFSISDACVFQLEGVALTDYIRESLAGIFCSHHL